MERGGVRSMYNIGNCPKCGYIINDSDRVCPYCGENLYPEPTELEQELEKFNWGAFLCALIWGLGHNCWWCLLLIPISLIPYVGIVFTIIFSFFMGNYGNKIAWKYKKWESLEEFRKTQRQWVIISLLITSFLIIIHMFYLGVFVFILQGLLSH